MDKAIPQILDKKTRKIGLMGGTFDPIHQGHLDCAQAALDQLDLDEVLFIPAANPVYKLDQRVTTADHRVAMVLQAIADNRKFKLDACEIARGGKTYTADTLRELRRSYPADTEFYLIAGADAALTIPRWKESDVIAQEAHIVAVSRPGYPVDRRSHDYQELSRRFLVHWVEADTSDVSSSGLRAMIQSGEDPTGLVPLQVAAYIRQHGLYREEPKD